MIFTDISMSLDGFVAGPDPSLEDPIGIGGMQLHEWANNTATWREAHGLEGGDDADSEWIAAAHADVGAGIMGRKMYSGGAGPWDGDPNPRGWWGDDPPFHHPVFVLTHHAREPLEMEGGTTFHFVTGGVEEALDRAREAAQGKDIQVHGGGTALQQVLAAGALDVLQVHIAPVLLGSGSPLLGGSTGRLTRTRTGESPTGVIHVRYER
jgi:dihydrofolate reductase